MMFPDGPRTPGLQRFARAALKYIHVTGQVPHPTYFNNVLRNTYGTTLGGEETKLRTMILQLTGFVKDGQHWVPAERDPGTQTIQESATYVAEQWGIDLS